MVKNNLLNITFSLLQMKTVSLIEMTAKVVEILKREKKGDTGEFENHFHTSIIRIYFGFHFKY